MKFKTKNQEEKPKEPECYLEFVQTGVGCVSIKAGGKSEKDPAQIIGDFKNGVLRLYSLNKEIAESLGIRTINSDNRYIRVDYVG